MKHGSWSARAIFLIAMVSTLLVGAPTGSFAEEAPRPGSGNSIDGSSSSQGLDQEQGGGIQLPTTSQWARQSAYLGTDNGESDLKPGVTITLREARMRPLYLPPNTALADVRVTDQHSGQQVPLNNRPPLTRDDGAVFLPTPTLPPGEFSVTYPGGEATIVVGARARDDSPQATIVPVLAAGGSLLLIVIAGAFVLGRRKGSRVAAAATAGGAIAAFAVSAGVLVLTTSTPAVDDPSVAWRVCSQNDGDIQCKTELLLSLRETRGDQAVAAFLETVEDPNCHSVAHEFGYEMWRTDPSITNALARSTGACLWGVIHGTTESISTFTPNDKLAAVVNDYCAKFDKMPFQQTCFHGAGHGTIWRTNGDLLLAYELCDAQSALYPRTDCHGSAVMEWADRWGEADNELGRELVTPHLSNIAEVCLEGPDERMFKHGCYTGTNHRSWNPVESAEWCMTREQGEGQDGCFGAIGENFLYWMPYYAKDGKSIGSKTYEEAVPLALEHRKVCDGSNGKGRDVCSSAIARAVASMWPTRDAKADMCMAFPEDLQDPCLQHLDIVYARMQMTPPKTDAPAPSSPRADLPPGA